MMATTAAMMVIIPMSTGRPMIIPIIPLVPIVVPIATTAAASMGMFPASVDNAMFPMMMGTASIASMGTAPFDVPATRTTTARLVVVEMALIMVVTLILGGRQFTTVLFFLPLFVVNEIVEYRRGVSIGMHDP